MQKSPEIRRAVEEFYDVMERGDVSRLSDLVSADDSTLVIGSDPDEWIEGRTRVLEVFDAQWQGGLGSARIESRSLHAYEEGGFGWAADAPRLVMPDGTVVPLRVTGVFRREAGSWRLLQLHTSIGVPNAESLGLELPT